MRVILNMYFLVHYVNHSQLHLIIPKYGSDKKDQNSYFSKYLLTFSQSEKGFGVLQVDAEQI